jgi:hypothetical protein
VAIEAAAERLAGALLAPIDAYQSSVHALNLPAAKASA